MSTLSNIILDDCDQWRLDKFKYRMHSNGYVVRSIWKNNRNHSVYLHREIMNAKQGQEVDHINLNKRDNRKENLRVCSSSENKRNCRPRAGRPFKGVYPHREMWKASITFNKKAFHLGVFSSQKEAAIAYDHAAKKYFGEFSRLNFI